MNLGPLTDLDAVRGLAQFGGVEHLPTPSLVALVLGSPRGLGATEYAERVLRTAGSLASLSRRRPSGLAEVEGLGSRRAVSLLAAIELGRRVEHDLRKPVRGTLLSTASVGDWATPRLAHLDHEEVWVLCVDGRTCLRSAWQVGRGGIHGCALLPRDVLGPVVREAASAFVLVHNHPSGDPTPSQEDLELTRHLAEAARMLSTPLLDHVIVARGGLSSFYEEGLLAA